MANNPKNALKEKPKVVQPAEKPQVESVDKYVLVGYASVTVGKSGKKYVRGTATGVISADEHSSLSETIQPAFWLAGKELTRAQASKVHTSVHHHFNIKAADAEA